MLWMEYVRGGRIIDDDDFFEIATDLGEVLPWVSGVGSRGVKREITLT